MKKVAILTFHRALNYGAKFQAYALQNTIAEKYYSQILDYRCDNIEKFYFGKLSVKSIIKRIIFPNYCKHLSERKKRFLQFDKKYFDLSKEYTAENVLCANDEFDAFVVGSDQVWNPIITGNDLNYFLAFAQPNKAYSYAVSMGKAKLTDWNKEDICPLMQKFNNISLRERTSVKMVKEYMPKLSPYSVMDPVFLMTRGQWIYNFELKNKVVDKKYIFVYFVAEETNALKKAKVIAEKNGWDIKYIDAPRKTDDTVVRVNNVGPVEFLDLLFNSELVITTSFHALALSIILNKPFLYELSKEIINANSRLSDLAVNLELKKYEILNLDSVYPDTYDWDIINERLNSLRKESKEKLFSSLDLI